MSKSIKLYDKDLPDDLVIEGDLAIDTETMGLNLQRDRLCVVQIADKNKNAFLVHFKDDNYDAPNLKKLLRDKSRSKIFHFARFDVAVIKRYLGVDMDNIICTKIASKLARTYTDSHGLKELCRELLSTNISKQQQSSYWGSDDLTHAQLEYAAADVLYLHEIYNKLKDMLIREGRAEIALGLFGCIPHVVDADLAGWAEKDIFSHTSN